MVKRAVPEPKQVFAYLMSHGWIPEEPMPADGVMFTFREPDDFGGPITVLVPCSSDSLFYPRRVNNVVVTAAGMEDRDQDAVWADMHATDPTPAAPATDKSTPNGSAAAPKGLPTPHPE
jgi:hypothetical protein